MFVHWKPKSFDAWYGVLWCFLTEDHYLFKKCFLKSALIFGFMYSAGLKFEDVFLKIVPINYAVVFSRLCSISTCFDI